MMTLSDLLSIAVTGFFSLVVSWCLLLPFFTDDSSEVDAGDSDNPLRRKELLLKKERLMCALEDLEIDYKLGRVSKEEFEELKEGLTEETARCLEEIDEQRQ